MMLLLRSAAMKRVFDAMTILVVVGVVACGGSVSEDSGAGSGGTAGAKSDAGAAVTCAGLDQHACEAKSGCRADHCSCSGAEGYVGCVPENTPPTPCPTSCPFIPCDMLSEATACDARNDCHSVYWPGDCQCVSCCCVVFDHCANGSTADCKGSASCDEPPPDCANPACNGSFAVSHVSGCYDGCAVAEKCDP